MESGIEQGTGHTYTISFLTPAPLPLRGVSSGGERSPPRKRRGRRRAGERGRRLITVITLQGKDGREEGWVDLMMHLMIPLQRAIVRRRGTKENRKTGARGR